jgi:hypothetical protein
LELCKILAPSEFQQHAEAVRVAHFAQASWKLDAMQGLELDQGILASVAAGVSAYRLVRAGRIASVHGDRATPSLGAGAVPEAAL